MESITYCMCQNLGKLACFWGIVARGSPH